MCQMLWQTWQPLFLHQTPFAKVSLWYIQENGLYPLRWTTHSPNRLSCWRSVQKLGALRQAPSLGVGEGQFLGYGVVPGATILYSLLTLSSSHNGFWKLFLSIWLHTPRFPQEGCMIKWHSIFSAGWCQAQRHHHAQWAPRRPEWEQFWASEEWGGRGGEERGRRLLFILHVSFSGSHKFLCPVYFTQLSKWGLLI